MGFKIRLKKVNKVFPELGKVRAEDFFSLAKRKKKYLTKKEQDKLRDMGDQILSGNIKNKDWYFKRTKKGVTFL